MMTQEKYRAYQPTAVKVGDVLKPMLPCKLPVSSGQKHPHCANSHSNKRSNKTNPGTSLLSIRLNQAHLFTQNRFALMSAFAS